VVSFRRFGRDFRVSVGDSLAECLLRTVVLPPAAPRLGAAPPVLPVAVVVPGGPVTAGAVRARVTAAAVRPVRGAGAAAGVVRTVTGRIVRIVPTGVRAVVPGARPPAVAGVPTVPVRGAPAVRVAPGAREATGDLVAAAVAVTTFRVRRGVARVARAVRCDRPGAVVPVRTTGGVAASTGGAGVPTRWRTPRRAGAVSPAGVAPG
jgi:hypothetical protein